MSQFKNLLEQDFSHMNQYSQITKDERKIKLEYLYEL